MTASAARLPLLILAAAATIAADAPDRITNEELEAEPSALAMRLLGRVPPELTEARVNRTFGSISVLFAMHPMPAASGLCRVDLLVTVLTVGVPRTYPFFVGRTSPVVRYIPTTTAVDAVGAARLSPEQAERCRALTPLLTRDLPGAGVWWLGQPAKADEAAFAYRAIAAAVRFGRVSGGRCAPRSKRRCVDSQGLPRHLDARDIRSVSITRCIAGASTLCVEAAVDDRPPTGGKSVRVETGETFAAPGRPRIRSVRVSTILYASV